MKYEEGKKNKKSQIAQWLNDLKSSNNEKIGHAIINLSLINYPDIQNILRAFADSNSNFVKFACVFAMAIKGNYTSVESLVDFIKDDNKYIRKISINTLNSLLPQNIITYDYEQIDKLKNECDNIKEKIKNMRGKVKWDEEKNTFTF